jgi:hypothetical protein
MYRAARQAPWWFCTNGDCRFDLPADNPAGLGTLYAGTDPVTGMLDCIGPEMAKRTVTVAFLAERTVWALAYDRALRLADLGHAAAVGFGVTNELSTMVPYDVPQAWANAFAGEGLDGIAYITRFSTGPEVTGLALFDAAGEHDWVTRKHCPGDAPEIVDELQARHVRVEEIPSSSMLQFID